MCLRQRISFVVHRKAFATRITIAANDKLLRGRKAIRIDHGVMLGMRILDNVLKVRIAFRHLLGIP
jgi:hypothetical protein